MRKDLDKTRRFAAAVYGLKSDTGKQLYCFAHIRRTDPVGYISCHTSFESLKNAAAIYSVTADISSRVIENSKIKRDEMREIEMNNMKIDPKTLREFLFVPLLLNDISALYD